MARKKSGSDGAEDEDGQGRLLCRTGVLQLLHHVSDMCLELCPRRPLLIGSYRLLFMTYNGWVMLSVAVGAFIGYLAFGGSPATKSVACH